GEADARTKVVGVKTIEQRAARHARSADPRRLLRMDDGDRPERAVAVRREVGEEVLLLVRRAQTLPAQAEVERQPRIELPVVLDVGGKVGGAEIEVRKPGAPLRRGDAPEQEVLKTGERRNARPALPGRRVA